MSDTKRTRREIHDEIVATKRSSGVDRSTWERPTSEKTYHDIFDEICVSGLSGMPYTHAFQKLPHSVEAINDATDALGISTHKRSMKDRVDCYWINFH